jgi:hypothetical protein
MVMTTGSGTLLQHYRIQAFDITSVAPGVSLREEQIVSTAKAYSIEVIRAHVAL